MVYKDRCVICHQNVFILSLWIATRNCENVAKRETFVVVERGIHMIY